MDKAGTGVAGIILFLSISVPLFFGFRMQTKYNARVVEQESQRFWDESEKLVAKAGV